MRICVSERCSLQAPSFVFIEINDRNLLIECKKLAIPINGSKNCTEEEDLWSKCSFTCNPGFVLIGTSPKVCGRNATWTGGAVQCVPGTLIVSQLLYETIFFFQLVLFSHQRFKMGKWFVSTKVELAAGAK